MKQAASRPHQKRDKKQADHPVIDGELVLINEEAFIEPINVISMFRQYLGQTIDLKLGGATPISGSLFDNE